MTHQRRTWISGLIGIAAVIFIVWLSPPPNYQARGILLPAKTTRPASQPDSIVQLSNRPYGAIVLGQINIERKYPAPKEIAQKEIGQLAQRLAAEVGANAFVVNNFRLGAVTRSRYIFVFQATAVYAPTIKSAWEPFNL